MQATGFSPDLTRKTTLTVFFHTIFPRANRTGGLHGETGERKPLYRGEAPVLILRDGGTRKRFPHHTAPSLAVGRGGACWQVFCLADLGERKLFHVYHRMGIGSAGILCYIDSTEVNRWVPSGQLVPGSMKQSVGFFFYFPDAVRRFYDK